MTFKLRDYQERNIAEIRSHLSAGLRSVCWQLPTGGGKTAGAAFMAGAASARGRRVWFVCHRRELIRQSSESFRAAGIAHGFITSGSPYDRRYLVHICGIDALRKRLDRVDPPDLIIWDESHHLAAASWSAIFAMFPSARNVGLTATPERPDGQGLGAYFNALVTGPSPASLIASGHLSPYRLFAPRTQVDLSGVHTQAGDFNRKELNDAMSKPKLIGDAVQHYLKIANGRPSLLFAPSIEYSENIAARFRDSGVPAAHVDAKTDPILRDRSIADLEGNALKVLCNVDLFGEGVSVNNVACIMQMRPTQSLTLHLQQIGRGLRPYPGKSDCIILDHSGNAMRHGLPDDEREWSLDGRERKRKSSDPDDLPVKQCTHCYAINKSLAQVCRECGRPFVIKARVIEEVEGELAEVDPIVMRQQFERARASATDLASLTEVGRMKGMKQPAAWAAHVMAARDVKRRRA